MSKRARSIARWIILTLLLGAAVHLGVVVGIPYVVGIRLRSLAESNTLVHGAKPSAAYNPVRRSSPDMIYSACPFDLSDGPLHISAPVPNSYMSVSCFALNTDNFYVKNDQQVDGAFEFVLIGPGTVEPAAEGTEIVRSPTTTGGILFRYFVGDGTHETEIEAMRRQIKICRDGHPITTEAEFRGVIGSEVRLWRISDGETIMVPISQLSEADQGGIESRHE